jgi:hypothetical protein
MFTSCKLARIFILLRHLQRFSEVSSVGFEVNCFQLRTKKTAVSCAQQKGGHLIAYELTVIVKISVTDLEIFLVNKSKIFMASFIYVSFISYSSTLLKIKIIKKVAIYSLAR